VDQRVGRAGLHQRRGVRHDSAAFRGDSLVLPAIGDRPGLGVVEAATGELRWSVRHGSEAPGGGDAFLHAQQSPSPPVIVDRAGGWAVLAGYDTRRADPTEHGVMALSGEDGHVVWKTPVAESRDAVEGPEPRVTYAADGIAVIVVAGRLGTERGYGNPPYRYTDDPRLVAVDTADGAVLWEREGLGAAGIDGDTVFAYPGDYTDSPDSRRPAESVAALDAATGEVRWDLSYRHPESAFVLAAGDLAVVKVPNPEQDSAATRPHETLVVEATTGREVVSFGTTASACAADDELIACAVSGPPDSEDSRLATLQVDDREAGVSEAALPPWPMTQG
jgi:hypothetical protein